jgi:hypothetical protein
MAEPKAVPAGVRARAIVVMLALAASEILALVSLVQGIRFRAPLAVLAGLWFWICLAATLLASVTAVVALLRLAGAWRRGARRASSLSLRALVATVVLGGAAFLVSFREFETPWISLFGSGCLGLWAGFLILEERLARSAPRLVRALDLILFDLALVLFLTEASLRVVARVRPSPLLATFDAGAEQILANFRQPAGILHLSYPTNRRGHYDEEFTEKRPGERLIACIGDSFSFSAVPHYWHYTTICERQLPGTRVDNFGVPGVGPPEYEILLRTEALSLHPDLVVIAIFVGNDVTFLGSRDVGGGGVLRSWLDRRQNRIWTLIDRLARIRADPQEGGGDGGGGQIETAGATPGRIDEPEELERAYPWLHDPTRELVGRSEPSFLQIETIRVREACMGGPEIYAPFFRSMQAILRTAGKTRIGVLLLPDQYHVDDDLWNRIQESSEPGERERNRPQRLIGAWLEARGVPFVDLLPRMREAPVSPDGSRHLFVLRNTHFNVRGNEIAAACLAELIQRMSDSR